MGENSAEMLETDKLKIAKELLKKAKELNDDELLAMANGLIADCTSSSDASATDNSIVVTERPKRKKKSKAISRKKKKNDSGTLDIAQPKTRKTKRKSTDESSFISTVYKNKDENGQDIASRKFVGDDGKEHIRCRSRPVNIKMKPLDTGIDKNDPINKKLKKVTKRVQSNRKHIDPFVTLVCEGPCGREKRVPRALSKDNYICDRCIMNKGYR